MTTARGIQGLPPEIFDIVLDNLGDTKSLLQRCSLVCRTWLHASRPRLFSIVSVQASGRRLSQFIDFLDTHEDLASYVRSLMVLSPMNDVEQLSFEASRTDAQLTPHTLVRIARQLPHLRRCQLYFVHVVRSPPDASGDVEDISLNESPIRLDVFHVFGSPRQETGPFLELLAHLRIDRLELELVTFVQGPNTPAALAETPPLQVAVRDIWMDLDTADDAPAGILSALSSALCPDTLQVFHCRWRYWDECTAVGSFLRNAGRSITDLTLNMSAASWVEEAGGAIQREGWVRLNLASCPNVRTFRTSVRLPLACPSSDVVNVRLAVASYRNLFSLLPHAVCTVVIHMSHVQRSFDHTRLHRAMRQDAARGLISVDFSEIEEALLELPRLERVILFMRGSEIVRQGGPGAVANAFPGLHAAGILHIRSGAASPSVSLW